MKIDEVLEKIFNMRSVNKRITKDALNQNNEKLKNIYSMLGEPCKNRKIIHIAGTNGKGSVATLLESIFLAEEYSVGKFTSPHILKFNERIMVNKNMISDENILKYYAAVMKILEENSLCINFFEITTFMALLYFEEMNTDFIFLEAGLGGRYDATNVVSSEIAVITNISYDHVSLLGDSLEKIAYRKAGIIKDGQLCIYAQKLPELEKAVENETDNFVNVLCKYENLEVHLDTVKYRTIVNFLQNDEKGSKGNDREKQFILPLFGKFQADNFLIAYEIAKIYNIDDYVIQQGLDEISLAGRFEIFAENPLTILDVAHNEDSVRVLMDNLYEVFGNDGIVFIFSVLDTKDIANIFRQIQQKNSKIFITSLKEVVHGLSTAEIKEKLENLNVPDEDIIFEEDILKAYNEAKNIILERNGCYRAIVVCGSFYEISKFKESVVKYI